MKIIRVITSGQGFDVDFHPDSSILLTGRPMFYPDFSEGWRVLPHVAVHVSRLGKGMGLKFASRYYDSLALAVRLVPGDGCAVPHGLLSGMDCSITCGEWLVPQEFLSLGEIRLGDVPVDASPVTADLIDMAVCEAGRLTTLRMGDLILIPVSPETGVEISPRMRLTAWSGEGSRELFNVKVV